ncbi:MAG: hypothetical protein IMZ53_02945 [Thermoplasmata archaeon]|nr:hypothetical protein [Thermoplasmata archaeon]
MPNQGLPFAQLPAGVQQEETPITVFQREAETVLGGLQKNYIDEARTLEKAYLSNEEFSAQATALQSRYKQEVAKATMKLEQKKQAIAQVQSLVGQNLINEQAGQEAMWKLVLPETTSKAMFESPGKEKTFPMGTLSSANVGGRAAAYADTSEDTPGLEFGAPKKQLNSLGTNYLMWRDDIAKLSGVESYEQLSPAQQIQLDQQWDLTMASDGRFDTWFTDKNLTKVNPEVTKLRPHSGKLQAAAAAKVSPFGKGVAAEKPKERAPWYRIDVKTPRSEGKKLDEFTARKLLKEAGGDKAKARQLAIQKGYKL